MATFPPAGYVPTKSLIAGIEVYAPAPPKPEVEQGVLDFKCPNCGATTAFSVPEGGLRCEHCGYYEAPQCEIVGKGAREFEFKVETLEQAAQGWGVVRIEIACQNCRARTSLPTTALTYTCPFCGSNKVIQREAPQTDMRPRFLVPFKVTREACRSSVQSWLGSSWMTPPDLKELSRVADFTPVYVPFWTFDATTTASWRAEVGHAKTERYRSGGEWKTRTVTVWRWESGNVRLPFDDLPLPGTQRLSHLLLQRVKEYDLRELVPYDPKFLAGFHAQAYDVPLEAAWEVARQEMREHARAACRHQASTSKIRNFSMQLDFSDESWRYVLLPLYVAAYRYGGAGYQVMINGQTGAIAGQRPVDWTKVWLVIGAIVAPGLLLSLAGVITALLGIGLLIGAVGFVLLVIGAIIGALIFTEAQEMDDA
ncbi:MAG: hypothetical protein ACLFU8_13710 [Anaerolineales bacterium]